MPKEKPKLNRHPLRGSSLADEALRRALLIKPPKDWKKAIRAMRKEGS
jgi:hypothetical protein